MGEAGQKALRVGFDRAITLEFHGARVSSDAGLFPYRDLDDAAQLAYNLGNFVRRLALPASVRHWTLTTLREKLIKIGAKVVHHARYVTFQLAEVAIPRDLYRTILERIRRFAARPAAVALW